MGCAAGDGGEKGPIPCLELGVEGTSHAGDGSVVAGDRLIDRFRIRLHQLLLSVEFVFVFELSVSDHLWL